MLWLYFAFIQIASVWIKQRLSEAVQQSREKIRQTVNCGFSLKYFGLAVWKECKGPHLFRSLEPTLSIDFFLNFFSHWSHWGWSHTQTTQSTSWERVLDKTLTRQHTLHNFTEPSRGTHKCGVLFSFYKEIHAHSNSSNLSSFEIESFLESVKNMPRMQALMRKNCRWIV